MEKIKKSSIITQLIGIVCTLIGSIAILISYYINFFDYGLKDSNISPYSFFSEAKFDVFIFWILWITIFFPFANSILHFITSPARALILFRRDKILNIICWIFSPLVAFFGFVQMSVSIFVGLVAIFGGIGGTTSEKQIFGIILIFLSILVFGFFGMWKKPHKERTSCNRLVLNSTRTSVATLLYLFFIFLLFRQIMKEGLIIAICGSVISFIGSIIEWIVEEKVHFQKKETNIDDFEKDNFDEEKNNDDFEKDNFTEDDFQS